MAQIIPAAPGYSGTPLSKKLGLKTASRVLAINAPKDYLALLEPLPPEVVFASSAGPTVDIAHVFVVEQKELAGHLESLRKKLKPDAAIWVSWPKKASKVPTDITEDIIRELALPMGLVDIKVCAVTEVWSGLKLVLRKVLRT